LQSFPLAKSQAPPSISKSSWVMLFLLKAGDVLVPLAQAFLKDHKSCDAFFACAS
jgi:hypothetical protein